MIVDMHNHVIPQSVVKRVTADGDEFGVALAANAGEGRLVHRDGFAYPLFAEFLDPAEKVRKLDERGFDAAIVSPSPTLFFYQVDGAKNASFVRELNEALARFAAHNPERLFAMGTLPMQSPEHSVAELDHLVGNLGIRSVIIGAHVDGVQLAHPQFRPVLRRAAELGVFILTHPYYFGAKPGLEDYYLTNLIGNPLDTAVAAANLIFSGVMEELPDLKIGLSHGGGFLPYQIGRLVHGQNVRKEAQTTKASPKDLLRRFYFDTITHDAEALRYLIATVGAERVLFASSSAFASSFATLGQVRMLKGDIAQAVDLYDRGIDLADTHSEFHIYLLVLKCAALAAADDRIALDHVLTQLEAIKPVTRYQVSLSMAPAGSLAPDFEMAIAQFDTRRAGQAIAYLHCIFGRLFVREEHRENIMRGLIVNISQRFGEQIVPEEVWRSVPRLRGVGEVRRKAHP